MSATGAMNLAICRGTGAEQSSELEQDSPLFTFSERTFC